MDAQHVRDVGTVQIAVEDADAKAHGRQRQRQADRYRRFADAPLAAQHRQHVPLAAETVAASKHPSATADFDFNIGNRGLQVSVQPRQLFARDVFGGEDNRQPAVLDQDAGDLPVGKSWRAVGVAQGRDERSNGRFVHVLDDRPIRRAGFGAPHPRPLPRAGAILAASHHKDAASLVNAGQKVGLSRG